MKNNYWLRSGMLNIVQNMTSVLFGFGGFYFLVRLLDKNQFGTWTLFLTTTTIIEVFRNGLISNALIKFVSGESEAERPKIISAAFTISFFITLLYILLTFIFADHLSSYWRIPELSPLLYYYTIIFIFSGLLSLFNNIEQAHFHFEGIFITTFLRQIIMFLYILICYIQNYVPPLTYLVYVLILAIVVSAAAGCFFVRKYLVFTWSFHPEWIKKIFNYGKYAFGTTVSSIISGSINQIMLGGMLSPVASGMFNVAIRITNLIEIPTNAIANIVFPQSAKRLEETGLEGIRYLYEKSVGTILALVIPMVLFLYFFADLTIGLIAGDKYDDTIPLLKITLLYCLLVPYGRQFGTILDSIGKTRTTFRVVFISACINIGMNYFFIKSNGLLGAAYATLYSQIIGFVIGQVILYKFLKVNILHPFIYAYRFYPEFYQTHIAPRLKRGA